MKKMLQSALVSLGLIIFKAIPIERILAMLLNRALDKIDGKNMNRAVKTAQHLSELSRLFAQILDDKKLTVGEIKEAREFVIELRKELLDTWAKGNVGKHIEKTLNNKEVIKTAKVEPLLMGLEGVTRLPVILSILISMMLVGGCMTRTRCQEITAKSLTINLVVNDPEQPTKNAYARSINLINQDQMIEGGVDTIASGNKTDPSLALSGDSALGALGALAGGAVRGYSAADKEEPPETETKD